MWETWKSLTYHLLSDSITKGSNISDFFIRFQTFFSWESQKSESRWDLGKSSKVIKVIAVVIIIANDRCILLKFRIEKNRKLMIGLTEKEWDTKICRLHMQTSLSILWFVIFFFYSISLSLSLFLSLSLSQNVFLCNLL